MEFCTSLTAREIFRLHQNYLSEFSPTVGLTFQEMASVAASVFSKINFEDRGGQWM